MSGKYLLIHYIQNNVNADTVVMCNIQTVELLFVLHYAINMHYAVHKNRPLYFFRVCAEGYLRPGEQETITTHDHVL